MKIKLTNVDINALKALFERSLNVSNSLDFTISSEKISSSTANDDHNFWKEWVVETKGIFESEPFEMVKVLFSNGLYFKNKFLGLFSGQKCEIIITTNDKLEAESFEVIGQTSFGTPLKVNLRTTRYELARTPMGEEHHNIFFNMENEVTSFDVEPNIIAEINKLRGLNAMADNPVAYVTFKGGNGVIKAYDSSFEFDISEYTGESFEAKFPKKSLTLLDNEPMKISFCKSSDVEFEWFIITGKNALVTSQSISMLMTSIASDGGVDDDIFGDQDSWGNVEIN